ncbi:urea transporter [Parabacteroides distasonis]|jgi:urea transporter|uniref:urea transporter n=1 Tax=Parabacteroides distasonis TaxID=823 RepID=UPI001D12F696|nr:urea transporter [Parabacteroides distasonis]MCC2778899.1 urea transporter [Parabacteroides distasonis]MCQ5180032.1 urea transporter [Parabacteroides distasonis]
MHKGLLVVGRGIGQVMFQGNALSGLLMLIGIACSSWTLALLALAGNIASTLAAYLLGYSREDIREGLYGFNGTLVGIAIGVFMRINIGSISLLLMGSALSSGIARQFNRQNKLPGYTAPFILSVWILLILCRYLFPSLMLPTVATPPGHVPDLLHAFTANIGQVMFQGNMLTGLFFLLAILVNSRLNAAYTIWGASLPLGMILLPATSIADFNMGLLGYNGVLCAIAAGNHLSIRSLIRATLAILLSIGLQIGGMRLGITTLTAPFVLSVWITNLIIKE